MSSIRGLTRPARPYSSHTGIHAPEKDQLEWDHNQLDALAADNYANAPNPSSECTQEPRAIQLHPHTSPPQYHSHSDIQPSQGKRPLRHPGATKIEKITPASPLNIHIDPMSEFDDTKTSLIPSTLKAHTRRSLEGNAGTFVPNSRSKETIQSMDGKELKLESLMGRDAASLDSHAATKTKGKKSWEKHLEDLNNEDCCRPGDNEDKNVDGSAQGSGVSGSGKVSEGPRVDRTSKAPTQIDTSAGSSILTIARGRYPLDLPITKKDTSARRPTVFSKAQFIGDLNQIEYPDGINSPRTELNDGARTRKFQYDRDFLLQFMTVCKEKPNMIPLDPLGLQPVDITCYPMTTLRGGSRRQRQSPRVMTVFDAMPESGGDGFPGTTPFMENNAFAATTKECTATKRGLKTMGANQAQRVVDGENSTPALLSSGIPLEGFVNPLESLANRWVATSTLPKLQFDEKSPHTIERKVTALLNKLTEDRFDLITDQVVRWINKIEDVDGQPLCHIVRLIVEHVVRRPPWAEIYARLCRKMMEQISPKVQGEGIKNADGKPIAGGQLFRKYLLNRCQEDLERGWVARETAAAAAAKAGQDEAVKAANEKGGSDESELYSEEYHAAQKAKRQGLGLIKFIGELFKLRMLAERIMHECVKKLLGNVENPEEEEIESLCGLLTTVGQSLDNPKAHAHMDVYFTRMKELSKSLNVSSRMQFMLQDLIEFRDRKWVTRNAVAAPTTIAAVHEAAAKDRAAAEKESYQRQLSMSRGGSRRGGERGGEAQIGPDGWAVAGGSVARPPPKAGDLSNFGKISKATLVTLGPSSVFAGKKDPLKRESISRTNSSSHMFSMLSQNPEITPETIVKASRPPSRKTSVDFGQPGLPVEQPAQRRKLQLLPRTKPTAEETPAAVTEGPSEDEPSESADGPSMTEDAARKKIDEDAKEFFAVQNLEEAEVYFTNLPAEHRFRLVDKLVSTALESKETDARLVGMFFSRAVEKGLCDSSAFEDGFSPVAEFLDDVAIDAPKSYHYMAMMLKGAGLDKESLGRVVGKSMESIELFKLVSS